MRRLIVPEGFLAPGERSLPDASAHYLRDVLRLDEGVEIELADGEGRVAMAAVRLVAKDDVVLTIGPPTLFPRDDSELTLIQCVAKGDKMDAIVRQTTELGVSRIVPVLSERTVKHGHRRVDRWRTIADDAIRVSRRAWRPELRPVAALVDVLEEPRAERSIVFALDGTKSLRETLGSAKTIEVLVGPEGGLSSAELQAAVDAGFTPVSLGPNTLRAETAAAAVTALIVLGRR